MTKQQEYGAPTANPSSQGVLSKETLGADDSLDTENQALPSIFVKSLFLILQAQVQIPRQAAVKQKSLHFRGVA